MITAFNVVSTENATDNWFNHYVIYITLPHAQFKYSFFFCMYNCYQSSFLDLRFFINTKSNN